MVANEIEWRVEEEASRRFKVRCKGCVDPISMFFRLNLLLELVLALVAVLCCFESTALCCCRRCRCFQSTLPLRLKSRPRED